MDRVFTNKDRAKATAFAFSPVQGDSWPVRPAFLPAKMRAHAAEARRAAARECAEICEQYRAIGMALPAEQGDWPTAEPVNMAQAIRERFGIKE